MKTIYTLYPVLILFFTLYGCGLSGETEVEADIRADFQFGQEGWTGGFSDYPVGEEDFFELSFGREVLPAPLDSAQYALKLSGANRSDDLFMFIKRELTGLESNTRYSFVFTVELASNAPEEAFGAGGGPGTSVFLKAGATLEEPVPEPEERDQLEEGYYQMNIDKGNQSQGGQDMIVIGDVAHDGDEFEYHLIQRRSDDPFIVETDDSGRLWLIIGTDSGFEGTTELYYNKIEIHVKKL